MIQGKSDIVSVKAKAEKSKTETKVRRNTYSEFLEFELQDAVAVNVKRCIAESGLTVEQLCIRTNLSAATINRLKTGKNISIRSICALAEALNKDWKVFFETPKEEGILKEVKKSITR